ncbi:hypothetical protein ACF0H5_002825 [Mactra antiquata]
MAVQDNKNVCTVCIRPREISCQVRGMQARRLAAELREIKRIEEERRRQEQLEQERLAREKAAEDEQCIEESLKSELQEHCIGLALSELLNMLTNTLIY